MGPRFSTLRDAKCSKDFIGKVLYTSNVISRFAAVWELEELKQDVYKCFIGQYLAVCTIKGYGRERNTCDMRGIGRRRDTLYRDVRPCQAAVFRGSVLMAFSCKTQIDTGFRKSSIP